MSWCDFDLTFKFAVVTLTFKRSFGLYLKTVRCRILIHDRDNGWGILGCDLDLIVNFAVVTLTFLLPAILQL